MAYLMERPSEAQRLLHSAGGLSEILLGLPLARSLEALILSKSQRRY